MASATRICALRFVDFKGVTRKEIVSRWTSRRAVILGVTTFLGTLVFGTGVAASGITASDVAADVGRGRAVAGSAELVRCLSASAVLDAALALSCLRGAGFSALAPGKRGLMRRTGGKSGSGGATKAEGASSGRVFGKFGAGAARGGVTFSEWDALPVESADLEADDLATAEVFGAAAFALVAVVLGVALGVLPGTLVIWLLDGELAAFES